MRGSFDFRPESDDLFSSPIRPMSFADWDIPEGADSYPHQGSNFHEWTAELDAPTPFADLYPEECNNWFTETPVVQPVELDPPPTFKPFQSFDATESAVRGMNQLIAERQRKTLEDLPVRLERPVH
jgi:hypothetical protein